LLAVDFRVEDRALLSLLKEVERNIIDENQAFQV
jgi:hypothetical protein